MWGLCTIKATRRMWQYMLGLWSSQVIKSSQVYTHQYSKRTRQKSNARVLLAQVKCLSSSGPTSSWAEETTTPLRSVHGLFTKPLAAPWALKCLKIRSLGRVFSSVYDSHTSLR